MSKLDNHQWVSMGCPQKHKDVDIYQAPTDSKQGVRCCSMDGGKCRSSYTIPDTDRKCHKMTFDEAKELCLKKSSGAYRLCSAEELNSCCRNACSGQLDDNPVWIDTKSKGAWNMI